MKNKKPVIRFKGFSEEWEERELDTVFHKIRNAFVGVATPYYVSEGHFYLESNNVKDGQINRNSEIFINDEFYEKQKDNWLHTGDIAMVQSGHVGHSAVIPPELNNTAAHALIIFAEPKEKINSHFLNYQFQTTETKKELRDITTGNTIKHILSSEMKRFNVFMSEYDEQTQIGNFFKNLDSLITLHQRKYEKLEILKKAMLEKMFPKNGADVPEIRFKGFEGAWEEKDLGDVAEIKTGPFGSTLHAEDYVEDGEPIITTEHFKSGILPNYKKGIPQVSNFDYSRLKSYLLKSGDIVFSRVGSVDINAHIKHFQDGWLFSGRVLRVRTTESIDSEFLHQELSTTRVRNNVIMRAVGQTMPSINTQILKATQVRIPRGINEQKRIGVFFINLDNLLTLHQGELTKLKNLKKAMLEKMFV